jgi:acetylornithine deacetylase/succinyl-diaminopimelate desuccinylase-like protein
MHLGLLKEILAVPTCSRQEDRFVDFLLDYVRQGSVGLRGTCVVDEWNNVYIRKGGAADCPWVAAHIDTVHWPRPVEIVQQDGILFGVDKENRRMGIGADDKAGVFVCLELLERFDNIAIALFAAEEVGCVGAYHAPAAWFGNVGCVIEFDCPGSELVSYTCGGTQLFANDGEFIRTARPVLDAHELTRWQNHPFTDVMALRRRFDLSCLNLSCGYHNWHQSDEYLVLDEVEAAVAAGAGLVRALGCRRYPFGADDNEVAFPLLEVTGLQLV